MPPIRDALAIGGVRGNFGAGRDAQLTSYGATSADLTADRDIRYVWSRGDITGTYDAGRNFGGTRTSVKSKLQSE